MVKLYTSQKVIAIVGPTATGKSDLALKLAKKIHGEIISADSRAIYRGLDIGTAKVPGKWTTSKTHGRELLLSFVYKGIPHHLIDFLPPKKTFSAVGFAKAARKKITEIQKRDSIPIICGGTGFWIEAALNSELLPNVPPNPSLRRRLQKKSASILFTQLRKLNPTRARSIDRNNKRRLIRAIEVATLAPSPPQQAGEGGRRPGEGLDYQTLFLGLSLPNSELKNRIRRRFLKWLRLGLVAETKKLTLQVSPKRLREIGLQYPIVAEYLAKKISKTDMIDRSVNSIYHYAKRQKSWFKRNQKILWITKIDRALKLTEQFMNA